jgi:hypothetical protein
MAYNEILSHIESDESEETSALNVMTELGDGEITSEPLAVIAGTDPIPCAIYAKDNDLRELDERKQFKAISSQYKVRVHQLCNFGTLVDGGANGGVAGADLRVISMTGRHPNVFSIEDQHIVDVPIVAAGSVMDTKEGPVVAIMYQDALAGMGKTIRPCSQLKWYKKDFHHKSLKVPGDLQHVQTNDGYVIPINIKDGLLYVKIVRSCTDEERDTLLHVTLTCDVNWDPTALDIVLDDDAEDPCLDSLCGEISTPIETGIDSSDGETNEYLHEILSARHW